MSEAMEKLLAGVEIQESADSCCSVLGDDGLDEGLDVYGFDGGL